MKISVLTPSFNSGKYIERAIQSVIDQDYKDYEHIITDGGSKDDTLDIIKRYSHINYISERDKGQSDAMNKAFKMSNGDIIVYLNADDEFSPNAFKTIAKAFKDYPEADMIVGNLIYLAPDEKVTRIPSNKYLDIVRYWLNLFPNNPVSYFYKRKVQVEIGEFPVDNHFAMDVWFLLKAYQKFKVSKVDATLGIFHSDGNNKTALTDTGVNLHKTVKAHIKNDNPMLLPYFYYRFILAKFFK
ncbi:glycosyltransferase [Pedobacter sp. MC2016-14]|uniref:glycosyltransferase family 2 protein n=1 Tax=Pedobacter sp. MC2016-14 TaxID=2897327 RepID=UPI001E5C04D1|nr:glycosyltransferase family 2 protein [Pedobacter sp. MC2016-14]MCD0490214.1 glycosyltransferase [Pedobacter sp. MC2016-14]